MPYADFTYYSTEYKGAMPEEDFDRLSRQASASSTRDVCRAARNRSKPSRLRSRTPAAP